MAMVRLHLGEYEVVEARFPSGFTINIGPNVFTTIHTTLPHALKPGDKIPLFAEIPIDQPNKPSK